MSGTRLRGLERRADKTRGLAPALGSVGIVLGLAGCASAPMPAPSAELYRSALIAAHRASEKCSSGEHTPPVSLAAAGTSIGPIASDRAGGETEHDGARREETALCEETASVASVHDALALARENAAARRSAGTDGANRQPGPLHLRYAPESVELRRADAMRLASALAEAFAQGDTRLLVAAGRGGGGNSFDQATIAHIRVRRINEMLPLGLLVSIDFDPELADDTLVVRFVTAPQGEAQAK